MAPAARRRRTVPADPAFAPDATVEVTDVSVWFGPKVALSELSCSFGPGVTGLLGPNGAGKTTLMRSMTGLIGVNQGSVSVEGRDPRTRPAGARAGRAGARGRGGAGGADRPPVRALRRRPARRRRPAAHPTGRSTRSGCSRPPIGGSTGSARACGSAPRSPRRWSPSPQVLVLDEPLNGADPVQRIHLIALFKRLGAEGRTVIVSSHVLNEVERMAERVIVLIQGRLAAAGDHRGIRDAMDDRPRHVLVRSDDGRRLAGSLVGLESVAGVTFDRARDGRRDPDRAGPGAGDGIAPGGPRRRRCGSPRCGRSTTRWRACSGSSSDDGAAPRRRPPPGRGRRFAAIVGYTLRACFPPKRWAAILLPCAGALLFGLLTHAVDDPAAARVRQRRRRGDLRADHADRRARDRGLRARRRGAGRHVPLHVALAGADLADRARALDRRLDRRPGHDRARRAPSPPSSPACPQDAGAAFIAAAVGSIAYVAIFIAIGCITRRTAAWSLAFVFLVERLLGAVLTGIAQLSPMWESRAIFVAFDRRRPPAASSASGIPSGGAAIVRLLIVSAVALAIANWRMSRMRLSGATD